MTVPSLLKAVIFPDPRTAATTGTILKPGDHLTGRVAEITANGKVLIDFSGLRVLADTDLILHPGERLHVRVEEIGEQIKLKQLLPSQPETAAPKSVPESAGRLLDRLFDQLPAMLDRTVQADKQVAGSERLPDAVRQALLSIRNYLQPPLESIRPAEIALMLKSMVEHSGVFFEKRMGNILEQHGRSVQLGAGPQGSEITGVRQVIEHDLKANLLVLKNYFDEIQGRTLSFSTDLVDLKSAVDRLLAGIERQQHGVRTHPPDADTPPAITVFFDLKKTRQRGMLNVFMGSRDKKKDKTGTRISVLLSMDRIGEIQTDLLLAEKSLHATFHVGNEKVKRYLEKEMDRFADALADHFSSVRTEVRLHHHLQQNLETQTAEIFSDRQIDLRV